MSWWSGELRLHISNNRSLIPAEDVPLDREWQVWARFVTSCGSKQWRAATQCNLCATDIFKQIAGKIFTQTVRMYPSSVITELLK